MRFLPSTQAASVAGGIVTPLLMAVISWIELRFHIEPPAVLLPIVAVLVPLVVSTIEFRFILRDWRLGMFAFQSEENRRTLDANWGRVVAYLLSFGASLSLLYIIRWLFS